MKGSTRQLIKSLCSDGVNGLRSALRIIRKNGPSQIQFWFIAMLVGVVSGTLALYFRKATTELQQLLYGAEDKGDLIKYIEALPWYWIVFLPVVGGLLTGLVLHWFTPDARARSVADVIEGAALNNGRVEVRAGLGSALASLITLSTGGSSGREGPVVHLAAVVSTWVSERMNASGITGRDLLGCAVAGAVSASFNAPIAGALFALEVILRHFAVHAFAPIAIASVSGTIINRLEYDGVTEFRLPDETALSFYVELPAFLLLGLLCGLVAVVLMRGIFVADALGGHLQNRLRIPRWGRPMIAGGMLGVLALWFPQIIGVGYETTSEALKGNLLFHEAIVFAVLKTIAVAITLGGRMGGGVFSPSLMIGALAGLAFGFVATAIFPENSGSETLYALAGMGAVAAAVLGAPISTTLIIFELTGDWQTGLAVMVAVSLSTAFASRFVDRSFFLTQLERRNIHVAAGPQAYVLSLASVAVVMRSKDSPRAASEAACEALLEEGVSVAPNATLEQVLPKFDDGANPFLPVVAARTDGTQELLGAVFYIDCLRAYNRALTETAAEEHS